MAAHALRNGHVRARAILSVASNLPFSTPSPAAARQSTSLSASSSPARPSSSPSRSLNAAGKHIHTSAQRFRSDDPGGKPNDGSHRTIYDDFFNLLESEESQPIVVKSMSDSSITLDDGLVIQQPVIFLNGQVYLWDPPHLDTSKATPGGAGWEEWQRELWRIFEVVEPKPGQWAMHVQVRVGCREG
ncbi:NADH dehydrogenase [ubiquinone] 1 alpha subcomplex assembly factor 3 [Ceraceosorus bombacis]|uniref:NADH dehydrogenase [ubiquinone] 1 alpha subcomplex assembly factor 3 n=1 Tax=Ceraceosorus bombacis TaxID=401625 RepID=A0A0P1BCE5_9BASI|nr:NADH dehydrogenase [ubiquinone] 1 alpha subcomplex assembly factor 3 [Ceraceosorus bombacis]